jgi:uncharacterized glyoxalase superfamily protein PhnB
MVMQVQNFETILYVKDKQLSSVFYERLLGRKANLDVPGITEFNIAENIKLGLMPYQGIAKILGSNTPPPDSGHGIPRCELYLYVADVEAAFRNAMEIGAQVISGLENRDWGDKVCYFSDPDGHVIAFAGRSS